ncbi:MAG: hypothetical protein ACJAQW_001060 [Paracoccaceae bacterium]|jgi:hypothetical protein
MAEKSPFDFTEMFKGFDPEQMKSMFDPKAMMKMFEPGQTNMFNADQMMEANKRNFEAVIEANASAAEAYKTMLDNQMKVFSQITEAASSQLGKSDAMPGADAMKTQTAAMSAAVKEALTMMKTLADTTRDANEKAFNSVQGQITEVVDKIKKT